MSEQRGGRKSKAELSVVSISGKPQRLRAPDNLSPAERAVFADIVSACRPESFIPSDTPLLESYARAIVQERTAMKNLQSEGYVLRGRPSPWLTIKEKAHREIIALSLRLRLSPQGRRKLAEVKAAPNTLSVYERMALEEKDEEGAADVE
jgi:P27 family predicted phage terminase small subunit